MYLKRDKELLVDECIRHIEYYDMQNIFDQLYDGSKNNKIYDNLMTYILMRENILLAYREIKNNIGSETSGTDKLTIKDIAKLSPDEVVDKIRKILTSEKGYLPKPVRRVEIPKADGKVRPLGIPCIWDRLIQQCIIQVLEPICEAKFSDNSYGYRPNRSVEHTIAKFNTLVNQGHSYYVIEFDIKSFFDNVSHKKLMRQIWALGIHDKTLLWLINRILKSPIKMLNGSLQYPIKGTPQGGIISPLLANIVLNELDHHIEDMWCENPITRKYYTRLNSSGNLNKSCGYLAMKKTNLKEMRIVRYADDFRIICKSKENALKIKHEITQWIHDRLKLEVSEEKTRIVDIRKQYSEFLGFRLKAVKKGITAKGKTKYVINSYMSNKSKIKCIEKLKDQIKNIKYPRKNMNADDEVKIYNSMVLGIHNYYRIATHISVDCSEINRSIRTTLRTELKTRISKKGKKLTEIEKERFQNSKQLLYLKSTGRPIYPIGYISCKDPMNKKGQINKYTVEGRELIHKNLSIKNLNLLYILMRRPVYNRSIEYTDNRLSLFSAQWGKCAITGYEFRAADEIHCHHKVPLSVGGTDDYSNLLIVKEEVHILIHSNKIDTINAYMDILKLNKDQIIEVNKYRKLLKLNEI